MEFHIHPKNGPTTCNIDCTSHDTKLDSTLNLPDINPKGPLTPFKVSIIIILTVAREPLKTS